jgi:glucose/arabinose dehydrogenase
MKSFLSRFSRPFAAGVFACGALVLGGAFALAQQMVGPQTKPPDAKEVEQRKSKGGYFPERMKNPNLSGHAYRMTVTPPSEIPLDRIKVPKGFKVELWAHGMPGVRMMARGSKGTIWAGTRAIGRVYEIKDKGGVREHRILAQKLTQPNGIAFQGGNLYVMAINRVFRYDGIEDNPNVAPVELTAQFKLPPDVHHNWKFIAFGPDSKLYVQVGAPCNICEPSDQHAQIRRYVADGSNMEVVARGVRNTVGFDFHPRTGELWFTDNGRDWQGENGPEDELNRVSKAGQFFGFPYCHANGIPDMDVKKKDPCKGVTLPAALMGPHAAALGMRFYASDMFPKEYKDSIFVARRGSWNRSELFGYDVVHVKLSADGRKVAKVTPFMTGFKDDKDNKFWGRPVDVLMMPDGSMLVADEQVGAIYRVTYSK